MAVEQVFLRKEARRGRGMGMGISEGNVRVMAWEGKGRLTEDIYALARDRAGAVGSLEDLKLQTVEQ